MPALGTLAVAKVDCDDRSPLARTQGRANDAGIFGALDDIGSVRQRSGARNQSKGQRTCHSVPASLRHADNNALI